jgi:hypothetical protein
LCPSPYVPPLAVAARHALATVLPTFPFRLAKLQQVVHAIRTRVTEAVPTGIVIRFDPPVPQSSLVHVYFPASVERMTAGIVVNASTRHCSRASARLKSFPFTFSFTQVHSCHTITQRRAHASLLT